MSIAATKRLGLALVALMFIGLSACSSSEESSNSDTSTTSAAESTETTETGAATLEQCEALSNVPEDQAALDATVGLFPDELQSDVRQFSDDVVAYVTSVDEETGEPTAPTPEASEALTAFTAGCAELVGGGDAGGDGPTFSVTGSGINGTTATFIVTGSCPDGSFPTDVQLTYGPLGEVAVAEEPLTPDGSYEFDIEVTAGASEADVLDELGVPDDIEGTCS